MTACQADSAGDSPTVVTLVTETPRPALLIAPTHTPRPIQAPTDPPTDASATAIPVTSAPQTLFAPAELPAVQMTPVPPLADNAGVVPTSPVMIIGTSVEGRAITAQRFGTGSRAIVLVGGMHGGWEANTVELMNLMIDHFAANPADVPPDVTLYIVAAANPDGVPRGRTAEGRFNANGVDLNRNWSCEWSREAFWRQEQVNPGVRAFSEPETIALADWLLSVRPAAALFYHSAANGVFAGNCGGDHGSAALAQMYAEAAGYNCCDAFSAYPVTGTAAAWADGQGIAAADVELITSTDPEFDRNLRAVLALMGNGN